jgi:outer membrane protein TolC
VRIGIITDGPSPRFADFVSTVEQEIGRLLERDARVEFGPRIEAAESIEATESAIEQLFDDPEVDVVLTLGPVASHIVCIRSEVPKPVVASFIYNPRLQGLPLSQSATTGVPNLNYVAVESSPRSLIALLELASPNRVAVFAPAGLVEIAGDLSARLEAEPVAAGLRIETVPVSSSAAEAIAAMSQSVDAAFVLPLPRISSEEFSLLADGFIERGIASFSWLGAREVRAGLLAGWLPEDFPQRLARRTAINVQRVVLGEDAGNLPVFTILEERTTLNLATANAIGLLPPWRVYIQADLVGADTTTQGPRLTLAAAVAEAIEVNLDLAAEQRFVAAGEQNVRLATSPLLPQLGVGLDGRIIDADRAEASFGILPERSLTGEVGFSQVIYDEQLWASRSIEKSLQESRTQDLETLSLDIALDAAATYLSVLRAETFERIQRENLALTRSNLELARIRFSVGVADASEVYRWESQIAGDRQALVDAASLRAQLEIELRRILNRPLDEPFTTIETGLDDPMLATSQQDLGGYIENPMDFMRFQTFMANEALEASPELQSLRALKAASSRSLQSANRSFYLPALSLDAGLSHFLSKGGATGTPPPGLGTTVDNTRWQVGLVLSYPVFAGLARSAQRSRAREELSRVQLEIEAATDRIDERVRTALLRMGASRTNIDLSQEAADASARNYGLVREAYARGVGNIINLLDAQVQQVVAEEQAATAVYDFLIDLLRVERAIGRFYFFSSPEDFQGFMERLETYFQDQS